MPDIDQLKDLSRVERVHKLFGLEPFEYQADLLDYGASNDVAKAAVKPGRQVGKTVIGGAIAAERALSGHDVMILGPFQDTVAEMMEAARNHLHTAEEKINQTKELNGLGAIKQNKTDWEFSNGGRLRSRTVGSDGTQIRGKNPDIVLVDEAAYIADSIFTKVIEPFFSTHQTYEFYLFSTPAGKTGYFYEKVEHDESFFSPHWPSKISPLIDESFLEEKRNQLNSQTFAQEYLGEFIDEGETFLSHDLVNACVGSPELNGRIWLGVDVARKGADRTVYTAMDESGNAEVLKTEDSSTIPGIVGQIKAFNRDYGFEEVLVDENAVGGGVVDDEELNAMGIMNGVTFSTKSKSEMYNRLKSDFENEDITIPNDRKLRDELTSLEFEVTGNGYYKVHHPPNGHDDHADSLALANYGRNGMGKKEIVERKARSRMLKGR